jgi:hypothetical protein
MDCQIVAVGFVLGVKVFQVPCLEVAKDHLERPVERSNCFCLAVLVHPEQPRAVMVPFSLG